MAAKTNQFHVDLAHRRLALRAPALPDLPELADGITVEFLHPKSALFHLGIIGLVARLHRQARNCEPCFPGHQHDDAVRLLARSPLLQAHNAIESPYRTILGMWAAYDPERGIRLESRASYGVSIGGRRVEPEKIPAPLKALFLDLLKGTGSATPKNLRLWLNLTPLGLTPADIEVTGLDELLRALRAEDPGHPAGPATDLAAAYPPDKDVVLPKYYECFSLGSARKDSVQRSAVTVTRTASGEVTATVEAGPCRYRGPVEFRETVINFVVEGVSHSERLTFVLDKPLSGDLAVLKGVFSAISHQRRPMAGRLLLRRSAKPVRTAFLAYKDCDQEVLAFLGTGGKGLLIV